MKLTPVIVALPGKAQQIPRGSAVLLVSEHTARVSTRQELRFCESLRLAEQADDFEIAPDDFVRVGSWSGTTMLLNLKAEKHLWRWLGRYPAVAELII